MERDVYYDKMIYNSTEFTNRYFKAPKGVRFFEFSEEGGQLYFYHDILFTEKYFEKQDGGDQPMIKSGVNENIVLFLLATVNDDVYYGVYVKDEGERYKLYQNGYCNRNENGGRVIIPLDGKPVFSSKHYFLIGFQDIYNEYEVDDRTIVV